MKEKKNKIFIGKKNLGYFVYFTDNHYYNRNTDKIESYTYYGPNGGLTEGDYCDVLNKLLGFEELYFKGIKIKFAKHSKKIPKKEKETIKKLVNRLERLSIENRDLKYSLKMMCELSKNEKSFSQYKIIKQE